MFWLLLPQLSMQFVLRAWFPPARKRGEARRDR